MSKSNRQKVDPFEPLSDDELKILRATQEGEIDRSTLPPHDNSDLAKAKRYAKKNKWGIAFVIITVALLLSIILSLVIIISKNKKSTDDFTVTLRGTDEEYTVPYDEAMIDDTLYLDILRIARYADLVISGSPDSPKISCPDGSYVRFDNESSVATVNGERVKLGGEAMTYEGSDDSPQTCLVPFSFIELLFSHAVGNDGPGIRTQYNKKDNSILIGRVSYSDGAMLPIGFDASCFDAADDFQFMS